MAKASHGRVYHQLAGKHPWRKSLQSDVTKDMGARKSEKLATTVQSTKVYNFPYYLGQWRQALMWLTAEDIQREVGVSSFLTYR